ncbi:MAG: hypothetical protein HFH41_12275 [Lachnospiraceae bacterium]|nr:hypothetical protein [Lachnospiraceae bacterium]
MNIDYRQFYRGTTNLPSYGNNSYKKDTLVKYEFNTRDENGNKIMDKMSKEETLQVMKEVRSLYGDAVIVEFSGDAMAALVESEKTQKVSLLQEQEEAAEAKNAAFQKEIKHLKPTVYNSPAYIEDCGKEKDQFIYGTIRKNLRFTTDSIHMMQTMDKKAYDEYQKIDKSKNGGLDSLKYLTNWYQRAVRKNPSMVDEYEKYLKTGIKPKVNQE